MFLQVKAQEISHKINGSIPVKNAFTFATIQALKEYFAEPRNDIDETVRVSIVAALQTKGAAAWVVHNAIKRNYDKYRKGIFSSLVL